MVHKLKMSFTNDRDNLAQNELSPISNVGDICRF